MLHGRMIKIIEKCEFVMKEYSLHEKDEIITKFIADNWFPRNNGKLYPIENNKYAENSKYGLYVNPIGETECQNLINNDIKEYGFITDEDFVSNTETICVGEIIEHFYADTVSDMLIEIEQKYDEMIEKDSYSFKYPLGIGFVFDPN